MRSTPDLHRSDPSIAADDDRPARPPEQPTLGDLLAVRLGRRDVLKGALAVTVMTSALTPLAVAGIRPAAAATAPRFVFDEIEHGVDATHHVAPGYSAQVLLRWGDPVVAGAPAFDPERQSAESQAKQFGYNNDFIGFVSLPEGSKSADHGLLCVNHEYTNPEVMFPGVNSEGEFDDAKMTKELVDVELAAHGTSIVEIRKRDGRWAVVADSPYNRRITLLATEFAVAGPAAGHPRLQTKADPGGGRIVGTINNCAGGITPWGTYLSAEENFHQYFQGEPAGHAEERNYKRYGVAGKNTEYPWGRFHDRFDIAKEPNEANRFGWIVEIDPFDPRSVPVKRTALGRLKHEGAETIVAKDGRVVIFSGDDQQFEYIYKFVSAGRFDGASRTANRNLLDSGTLYVAKLHADGKLDWLPLTHGQGPLTADNGFASQADVMIETRRAADLLGATPMDRPEDVEANPQTGKVYVLLTNNTKRKAEQVDASNPRADNTFGHILEITPAGGDHAAVAGTWEILVLCGNPADPATGARWNPATSNNGWFASPDNCAVDPAGRLWVATDQGNSWSKSGTADGIWALETDGPLRGTGRMFFRGPIGSEICGPRFSPDGRTLFVAVQHPATDGTKAYKGFERRSTFEDPATRWPDFREGMPPRPSLVVITRDDGGAIGG
jgi:hypothetical protein